LAAKRSNSIVIVSLALGLCFLAGLGWLTRDRSLTGVNDFIQLYAGATLLGDPGLYSPEVNAKFQLATIGVHLESVYYSRLPLYAFFLKPLSWLPYQAAYAVFQCLSLLALAAFLKMRARTVPELLLFASLSIPLLANLVAGQDLTFVLLFAACSLALAARGKDFEAGLILTMCLIKPHLFVLVPVAMIAHRRWRFVLGGVVGSAVWLTGSTIAAGTGWLSSYMSLLGNPVLHPEPQHMPNIHGLVHTAGGSAALEVVICLAAVLAYCWFAFRSPDFELAFGIALAGSLLLSFHSYTQDCAVLLLTFAIAAVPGRPKALRGITALVVAPPIYLLLFAGSPLSVAVPVALLVLLGVAAITQPGKTAATG